MAEDSRGVDPRRREAAEQVYMMTMILIMLMMTTSITMGRSERDQIQLRNLTTKMARLLAARRQLEEEQKQLSWSQLLEVFQCGFYCCYVTEWSLKQGKNQISELLFLYGNLFEAATLWRWRM